MLTLALVLQVGVALPDSARLEHKNHLPRPLTVAVRVSRPPMIDGVLEEHEWQTAAPAGELRQLNPKEGDPASERTEVRILYDDQNIYVGARMFERDTSKIRTVLTRHDQVPGSTDLFIIYFDSYHDHIGGYGFAVTPAGVRIDAIAAADEEPHDMSWDPVWEGRSHRDAEGWTVEMRIPLSQLRFPRAREQLWGMQIQRVLTSRSETDAWAFMAGNASGFSSRFGHLAGIANIPSPHRLEVLPYASEQLDARRAEPGDPFFKGKKATPGLGLDLKYGVTSNLTLDATINPDFGQVEADPAQLNLTAFESFFEERRPFFLEGAQIFDFPSQCRNICFSASPTLFYSRRIGRAPSLSPSMDLVDKHDSVSRGPFVDAPTHSTILGAGKLTGKLGRGTSLGVMHVETGRATGAVQADVFDVNTVSRLAYDDAIEPHAHYSVARARQDLRGGATTVGLLATSTIRDLDTPRFQESLNDRAMVAGVDLQHRWDANHWAFNAYAAWSGVHGSPTDIAGVQRSSARYFQRPDQRYALLDTTRTSLDGSSASAQLSYNAPAGYYGQLAISQIAPGFEVNDLGFQPSADSRSLTLATGWRRPKPSSLFRYQGIDVAANRTANFGGDALQGIVGAATYVGFQNYWSGSVSAFYGVRGLDQTATRGGPSIISAPGYNVNGNISGDERRPVSFNLYAGMNRSTDPRARSRQWNGGMSVSWRPAANATLSIGPNGGSEQSDIRYVTTIDDAAATATFGKRYVFADVVQRTLSVTTRADYTFNPRLSLQLYLEPFTASASHTRFKELRSPRTRDFTVYSAIAPEQTTGDCKDAGRCYRVDPDGPGPASSFVLDNPNVRFQSLRGTSVLRWEYRPGATLFMVWTQSRSGFEHDARFGGIGDMPDLFTLPLANVFLVKASYWLSR